MTRANIMIIQIHVEYLWSQSNTPSSGDVAAPS